MKTKIIYAFWGMAFILAGGGLLGGSIDFEHLSQQVKLGFFAVISAAFILTYILDGVRKWAWLFPALFCAALALSLGMEISGMENSPVAGVSILASTALPFYVGFALDRKRWGLLIPANILAALTIIIAIDDRVQGGTVAALALYAAALPFLVIYLSDRSKHWALISAVILAVVGTMPLVSVVTYENADLTGPAFLFLFALCFFAIYFWAKNNWWAVIPGGAFASFGLVAIMETLIPHADYPALPYTWSFGVYIWVLFLGFAATFGILWLLRKNQPTGWARYPAAGMLGIAVLAFILGSRFQEMWPAAVMIVTGSMLLVTLFTRKKLAAGQPPPEVRA